MQHRIIFEITEAEGIEPLSPAQFIDDLKTVLPKEWFGSLDREDAWVITSIGWMTGQHQIKRIAKLEAYLEQERKMTRHLDAKIDRLKMDIKNLTEKNGNQFDQLKEADALLRERTHSLDVSQHEWQQRGVELIAANADAQKNAAMVHGIVAAMEGAGYDISGWGNDEELTELEAIADRVNDSAATLTGTLDHIRTRR